jgi:hypothetical protein
MTYTDRSDAYTNYYGSGNKNQLLILFEFNILIYYNNADL